jgi:hypothetical protein
MSGPKSENSKQPRYVYKRMKEAGLDKHDAAAMAKASIPKRRVPADSRPDAEETREKGSPAPE